MTPILRVSAIAGVLALAGCASWTPNLDFLSSGANVSLTIESDPPGADAKTSLGPSCRTPCMIPVPADREFTVNYSLPGYQPQTIAVVPRSAGGGGSVDVASGLETAAVSVEVSPNPVYAQLQLTPPPAPTRKGRGRPKQQQR